MLRRVFAGVPEGRRERKKLATRDAIAETAGAAADDVIPAVVARTLVWTHRTIFRDALTGEELEQMAARLRVQATRAYDRLAAGLAVYGAADPGVDTAP